MPTLTFNPLQLKKKTPPFFPYSSVFSFTFTYSDNSDKFTQVTQCILDWGQKHLMDRFFLKAVNHRSLPLSIWVFCEPHTEV